MHLIRFTVLQVLFEALHLKEDIFYSADIGLIRSWKSLSNSVCECAPIYVLRVCKKRLQLFWIRHRCQKIFKVIPESLMDSVHISLEGIEMFLVIMDYIHFLGGFPVTVDRQKN